MQGWMAMALYVWSPEPEPESLSASDRLQLTSEMSSTIPINIPAVVRDFFAKFPTHTYPDVPLPSKPTSQQTKTRATLWIAPPKPDHVLPSTNLLSRDVECLKWQAYIALRGLSDVGVRWDVAPDGSVDGRLPSLQTADRKVLGARMIPGWVDDALQAEEDAFEGYRDAAAKDESRAWVALLEGIVHVALVCVLLCFSKDHAEN